MYFKPLDLSKDLSPPEYQTEACLQLIDIYREYYPKVGFTPPWISYFIFDEDTVVGSCGFTKAPEKDIVEIAYWTFPEFEGKGIASFACTELIKIATSTKPDISIIAKTAPEKNSSTHILEKNRFTQTAIVQDDDIGDAWQWQLQK